ncbi:hypothetical protein BC941DRAFT_76819 [Chlamydoabsidia padenii]|nr:hypothetical protein BC941DRAFT_76819 [Chlamydoabsidia padenii]
MGSSLLHALGLLFTVAGLVLLIFVNIGTTFNSSFLPNLYLAEATIGSTSIRLGPYNSCITNNGITNCTKPVLAQDYANYGDMNGVEWSSMAKLANAYKFIVLVIPASVLALISMFGWLTIRENRSGNRLPIIGAIASILGMICGAATLALVVVCYQLLFKILATKVQLVYHWGPSLYMLGVGSCGCLLVSFILYIIVCFQFKNDDEYTYFQKDEHYNYGEHQYRY